MNWTEPTEEDREMKNRGRGTENMKIQRVTGTVYPCTVATEDMLKQMPIVKGLRLRDDDVISIGMQRSGNHWCFEILNMILNQDISYHKDYFFYHLMEHMGPDVQEKIDSLSSPRQLTLHARITKVPEEVFQRKTKLVYIMRNPKDVWVSNFVCYSSVEPIDGRYTGTWDEYFQCQLDNTFITGSWFDHVWATETFMEQHPDHPIYILVYEHLKENPHKVIRELCHFLGRPDTQVAEIAQATDISTMKPALLQGKMADLEGKVMQKGKNDLIRKGKVGDWWNWFSEHQNEVFDALFKEKMAGSKLVSNITPYIFGDKN